MPKPILISVYNHKGGIGKTTSVQNIGYILSEVLGKKVLLVDADPQCSLTALINHDLFIDPDGQERYYSHFEAQRQQNQFYSMREIFYPSIQDINPVAISVDRAQQVQLTRVHSYRNLYLIPGSLETGKLDQLTEIGIGGLALYRQFPSIVSQIFRQIGELNNIDIIIFDLSPSVGGFNRSMIMGCDYFFVPFFPDFFSYRAIQSLVDQIPAWKQQFCQIGFESFPKFLGAFPQKMRIRQNKKKGTRELEQAYGSWIQKIYLQVSRLQDVLTREGMLSVNYRLPDSLGIRDFISLGLDVQTSGRPICDTEHEHVHSVTPTSTRGLKPREYELQDNVRVAYMKIVGSLFSNIQESDKRELTTTEDFGFILELWTMLYEGLDPQSYRDLIANIGTNLEDEDRRLYTDDDIRLLLRHYLGDTEGLDVLAPMQGDSEFLNRDQLNNTIDDYLNRLQASGQFRAGRSMIIPLNLNQNHWTLICIRFADSSSVHIYHYDPLGNQIPHNLSQKLQEIFTRRNFRVQLRSLARHHQRNEFDCGPWIVEISRMFGRQRERIPNDIQVERANHEAILTRHRSHRSSRSEPRRKKRRR